MSLSLPHILIVALLLVILFGKGKLSGFMEDLGKGINAFKKGIKEGENEAQTAKAEEPKQVSDQNKSGQA